MVALEMLLNELQKPGGSGPAQLQGRRGSRDLGSGDHEPGLGEASRSTPLAGRASAGRAAAGAGFGSRGSPRYTLEATVG